MRLRPGFEFYAGVPILSADRKRIGALSIRGTSRTQFSVMDMNILHEMAFWASGELETISQKRELGFRDAMLNANIKISKMIESSYVLEKTVTLGTIEKGLAIVREALRASSVLLLRFSSEGSGVKSILHAYSISATSTSNLNIGQEVFNELSVMTLKKDTSNMPLYLDSLSTGAVTKEVDQYLSKNIVRCASDLLWSNNRPTGLLATFFEGQHRYLSQQVFSK